MSDRWWLSCGDLGVQWGRNEEPLTLLTLFVEEDKYVNQAWLAALRRSSEGLNSEDEDQQIADEELLDTADTSTAYGYSARAEEVRSRLALMGFTAEACRYELTSAIDDRVSDEEFGDLYVVTGKSGEVLESCPRNELLDRGLAALASATPYRELGLLDRAAADHIDSFIEGGIDRRILLAVQLESVPPELVVRLDLHDLVAAGYFDGVSNITELASEELAVSVSSGGPIIVVTEGVTDARYLQKVLTLAAPHVSHMFRFLDADAKLEMGAAQVTKTLIRFAAAGVTNRVIGVFDNDAAGRAQEQILLRHSTPSTSRYMILPDVPYGVAYPTSGPSGDMDLDINGRAVSIEFQFGEDVLRLPSGEFARVEWTGREASINAYQGSLSNQDKKQVQSQIDAFLDSASAGHDPNEAPWSFIYALADRLIESAAPTSFPGQLYGDRREPRPATA